MPRKKTSVNEVLAKIAAYGEFLPGSVRKTYEKRTQANGKVKVYEAQPIFTYTNPKTGRQASKRIPKEEFVRVMGLARKYNGFNALMGELMLAAIDEYLLQRLKKTPSHQDRMLKENKSIRRFPYRQIMRN